jgi:hypothetical protein
MNRIRTARRVAATLLLPAGLASALSSYSLVDPFISDGGYERALALAADCSRDYIPAMGLLEAEGGSNPGPFRFAALGTTRAGAEIARLYRPLEDPSALRDVGEAEMEGIADVAASARMVSYELDDLAISATSMETDAGCARVFVGTGTPVIPVGIPVGSVVTTARYVSMFRGMTDLKGPANWNGTVTVPGVDPNQVQGRLEVLVLKDGQPQPNVALRVRAVGKGVPGKYGATDGHTHTATQSSPAPTLRFKTGEPTSEAFTVTTNGLGKAEVTVYPWWRGGPETVLATAKIDGQDVTGARVVIMRHRRFVSFAQALGFSKWPERNEQFPFRMVGWTAQHNYNHFVQEGVGSQIAATMRLVWRQDPGRLKAVAANPNAKHWLLMNDMSLEYGGRFNVVGAACTQEAGGGGHSTHRVGLDFDVVPCYTKASGADVNGPMCDAGQSLHIDERTLVANVVGRMGGAIFRHHPSVDGVAYHYHIRFPEPPAAASPQRQ